MHKRHMRGGAVAAGLALMALGLAAPSASAALVAYYSFNDSSDPGVVRDDSGNGHVGTPTGAAAYTAGGGAPIPGGGGNAFQFFGDPDSVGVDIAGTAVPFSTLTDNNAGTVAFWTRTGSADQTHFGMFQAPFTRQFQAHVPWSDNGVYFDVGGAAAGGVNRVSAPITRLGSYNFNQWHHWAFVHDASGTATIYQDGRLFLTGAQTAPIGTIDTVAIGNRIPGSDEAITGMIDEFYVFNHALTQAEVVALVPEPAAMGLAAVAGLWMLRRTRRAGAV